MGWLVALIAAMTLMVSTGVWNPFPGIWTWLNTSSPLSEPEALWQERLGGVPKTVTLLDEYVVIEHRRSVEVRSRTTGNLMWETDADWAAVAGEKVISGTLLVKGYQVRDPATGVVVRDDKEAAAVWTFTDTMIDVSCRTPQDCQLTARDPTSGQEKWQAGLPGIGFVLFADNPGLAGAEPLGAITGQLPLPPLLGFRIDHRVHVVDTNSGQTLPVISPERQTTVHVIGGRVVHGKAEPRDGRCLLSLSGRDAASTSEVWKRDGYQVVGLSGCELRGDPRAGGNAVVATRPDGRQSLLDAGDGREVLVCETGEEVLATDGIRAVVRSADGAKLVGYALGRKKPLWTRNASADASAIVTRHAIVISDHSPDQILVLDPATGKVRTKVRSGAKVAALDGKGLILTDRRDLGYVSLAK